MTPSMRKSQSAPCLCSQKKPELEHKCTPCEEGEKGSTEYRVFFKNAEDAKVSPWHTIPLYASNGHLNMVCEIPRNTRAKFEVRIQLIAPVSSWKQLDLSSN